MKYDDLYPTYHLAIAPNERLWCFISNGEPDELLRLSITIGLRQLRLQRHLSKVVRKPTKFAKVCRKLFLTPKQMDALCDIIHGVWCPVNIDKDKNIYACTNLKLPKEYK
jgi:hypothetical protein